MNIRVQRLIAGCLLGGTLLAGCSDTQGDVGNRNIRPNSVRFDGNGNRVIDKRFANDQMNEMNRVYGRRLNSNNLIGSHQNYRMEMSQDIAERMASINGVKSAYVLLTDRNAYVAVRLNDSGNGRADESGEPQRAQPAGPLGYPRMHDAKDKGRDTDPLRHGMGLRSTRTDSRDDIGLETGGGLADDSRTNAYGDGVSGALKDRAAEVIKQMAPQIERVYVSANPEFVERLNGYMDEVLEGRPIQGFIAEFNAMAERIFPAESGTQISRPGTSWFHR